MFEAKRFQTNRSKAAVGPCGEGGGRAGLFSRAWGEKGVKRWELPSGMVCREAKSGDWGVWSRQEKRHTSCACGHRRFNTDGNGTFGKLWAIFTCKALFIHLAFVRTVLPLPVPYILVTQIISVGE